MQATGGRDAQLDWVLGIARAAGIPLWLEAGTLLGIAREGRPLAHDKDLDLALWAEHSGNSFIL
jgi:phosphorylcholine metabolism protein LicD